MEEQLETVLRKSLDAVDKKSKLTRIVAIGFMLMAVFFALAMTSVMDLRLEVMSGFIATIMMICGVGIGVIVWSLRNTRAILKAIETISASKPS
jgi:uncharacterized membrane protein